MCEIKTEREWAFLWGWLMLGVGIGLGFGGMFNCYLDLAMLAFISGFSLLGYYIMPLIKGAEDERNR